VNPIQHPACNDVLRRPPGTTEEECGDLHIMRNDTQVWSFWRPSAEELLALNAGGAVGLIVEGRTHPPLSICATHPTDNPAARVPDPSEYQHRMEALNQRAIAMTKIAKEAVALIAKGEATEKQTDALANRLPDMLAANPCDGSVVRDRFGADERDAESYRQDAAGWKAEAADLRARLETVAEVRDAAEANLRKLHEFVTGAGDGWPLSGIAYEIRQGIEARFTRNATTQPPR